MDELLRWNRSVNLTSITNRKQAIEKHLLDSLLLLPHLGSAKNILDMGSGGGLPSIPLAIAAPALDVVSVDSVGKKINFQKHVKRQLQIYNLKILQSRVEELNRTGLKDEKFDIVVSRAFTSLGDFIAYSAPWLKPGGRIFAMKGPEGQKELISAKKITEKYHLEDTVVYSYLLPYSRAERQLIILKKAKN